MQSDIAMRNYSGCPNQQAIARRSHPANLARPLMVRQPYSVAVPSTGGRLHPLPFWKGRGLGSELRTLPLGRDRWGRNSTKGGYIPNPYGRDLGLGYRVRTPSSQEGTGESKKA